MVNMKWKFHWVILALVKIFFCACSIAQESLLVEYEVRFNDLFDRGRRDRLHIGYLSLHQGRSAYYTVARDPYQSDNEHDVDLVMDTSNRVYVDMAAAKLISEAMDVNGDRFFVSDSLYPMVWNIGEERQVMSGYIVTRASTQFRGRSYEAWFAADIPVSSGPWKMGGLPGLILYLEDEERNLQIRFSRIVNQWLPFHVPSKVKESHAVYVGKLKQWLNRIRAGARASQTGDCLSCEQASVINFYSWEKIEAP